MNGVIKIDGVAIRKGYAADEWYYTFEEYYSPNHRKGCHLFASKTFEFLRHTNGRKAGAYIVLKREGDLYSKASRWQASIIVCGLYFRKDNLSLSSAFAQVKEWMYQMDNGPQI